MKKFFSLLVIATMLAFVAACGPSAEEQAQAEEDAVKLLEGIGDQMEEAMEEVTDEVADEATEEEVMEEEGTDEGEDEGEEPEEASGEEE